MSENSSIGDEDSANGECEKEKNCYARWQQGEKSERKHRQKFTKEAAVRSVLRLRSVRQKRRLGGGKEAPFVLGRRLARE